MILADKGRTINVRGKLLSLDAPLVMGILNVTPDSFYATSRQQTEDAVARRIDEMMAEGVDIIDVDSFATPTGSDEIVFQVWDDRALGYYPKTPRATSNFNGRALSTTNFLTVQGTYTAAKYRNAYCAIKP
jgi:dihydropteroate synthase